MKLNETSLQFQHRVTSQAIPTFLDRFSTMKARQLYADDPALVQVLDLIKTEFAYMDGVVDPPSTMHAMTLAGLKATAISAEIWVMGNPVIACMILTPKPPILYLGKLAVAGAHRGKGLSRRMIDHACLRARALGFDQVELGTRVELIQNQRAFESMGFIEVARECHPGFDRPTAIVYRKDVAP